MTGGRAPVKPTIRQVLITARWYLDAELFAEHFAQALERRLRGANELA